MDYTDITVLALSYADREDDEVTSRIDQFILLVESRINRKLKVLDMSARSVIDLTTTGPTQQYFQLPSDFGGLRDIQVTISGGSQKTLNYLNPEQMNNLISNSSVDGVGVSKIYYTIIAKQIQMFPPQTVGDLEIVYYQKIPNLNAIDLSNWVSDDSPDCYVFGLLVEISSFVKDADAFAIWKGRFDEALDELTLDDNETRWSGTPLTIKVG